MNARLQVASNERLQVRLNARLQAMYHKSEKSTLNHELVG